MPHLGEQKEWLRCSGGLELQGTVAGFLDLHYSSLKPSGDVDDLQRQFDRLEDMDTLEAWSSRSEERLLGLVKSIHSILLQPPKKIKPVRQSLRRTSQTCSQVQNIFEHRC